MQIIRVPSYDFRKLSTGQLLAEQAAAASGTLELAAITGFVVNQFAVLGYDNELENTEAVQVSAISSPNLSVGTTVYEHQPEFLVYPLPYDQVELYKKRSGGSMQLMERKAMDVDGPYTVFVDATAEKTDTYEYKYRNSVTAAVTSVATTGLEYVSAKEAYVTPAQVISYMNNPSGLTEADPNLIMLCHAYSDLLDHTIGRYQKERLWYHYKKVVIPMHKVRKNYKVRMPSPDASPVSEVMEAHMVNPLKGSSVAITKPYEVYSSAIVYLPALCNSGQIVETDRLHLLLKVGFFESNNIPSDITMLLCNAIAMHIRNEDMVRRYVHHSGQFVSGEQGVNAFVRTITVGKYTKQYFETAAEGNGQRVNSKALESMKVAFDAAMLHNNQDVLRPYKQTFSISFI